jgi:transposase
MEFVEGDIFLLSQKLDRFDLLDEHIKDLFIGMEGAVILSVPRIGVVTGAELYAEIGDISNFEHAGN